MAPSIQTAVSGLAAKDASIGSALVTTMQQIGGSIGIAIFSTVFASAAADYASHHAPSAQLAALAAIHGYTRVYLWACAIFLIGAVTAAIFLRSGVIEADPESEPVLAH
jgi:hypothetical protein